MLKTLYQAIGFIVVLLCSYTVYAVNDATKEKGIDFH